MAVYTLYREQVVNTTLEAAWDFIQNPSNLNRITPGDLDFQIVSQVPESMADGLLIEYRITMPVVGKQVWLTEIKHIRHQVSFVDEQRVGPYRFWYHHHEIAPHESGVKFMDTVTYQLPYGLLGGVVHHLYVKKTLDRIFNFRGQKIKEILS
ncbi:MAG: SRPBCC family protein [Pseudomonadota bacterium]